MFNVLKDNSDRIKKLEAEMESLRASNAQQNLKIISEKEVDVKVDSENQEVIKSQGDEIKNQLGAIKGNENSPEGQIKILADKIDSLDKKISNLSLQEKILNFDEFFKKNEELVVENNKLKLKIKDLEQDLEKKQNETENYQLLGELGISPEQLTDEELRKLVISIIELKKWKEEKVRTVIDTLKQADDIEEQERKLNQQNIKIKDEKDKIRLTKENIDSRRREIIDGVKVEKNSLEESKQEIVKKTSEDSFNLTKLVAWVKEKVTGDDLTEYLEELLAAQTEYSRTKSSYSYHRKEKLLKQLSDFSDKGELVIFRSVLDNLCQKQAKIVEAETKLEEIKKVSLFAEKNDPVEIKKMSSQVELAPNLPNSLLEEMKKNNKLGQEHKEFDEIKYGEEKMYSSHSPFSSSLKKIEPVELPTKLYNIKSGRMESATATISPKTSYSILSYLWGESSEKSWTKLKQNYLNLSIKGLLHKSQKKEAKSDNEEVPITELLTKLGEKSFNKAVEACSYLNIEWLWMDQLCIDQSNNEEKEKEIPKMGQYYSNAEITLIAINTNLVKDTDKKVKEKKQIDLPSWLEVLGLIINSDWFQRSWTYQEGWLSKQTIFMFDDYLVDGRDVAASWVLCQPSYTGRGKFTKIKDFYESPKKIATPLGWTYYEKKYEANDRAELRLNEALRAVKGRARSISVDGIYSILGLLSLEVELTGIVKYKLNECCQKNACQCEEKKWPTYHQQDLQEALLRVIKATVKARQGEHLSWHGKSSKEAGKCWMPMVYEKNKKKITKGGVNIIGGVILSIENNSDEIFQSDGIRIKGWKYTINSINSKPHKIELGEGFLIDGGTHLMDVVFTEIGKATLLGTKKSLTELKDKTSGEKTCLLITDAIGMEETTTSKLLPSVGLIAVEKDGRFHRFGLVELFPAEIQKLVNFQENAQEKGLKWGEGEWMTIGSEHKKKDEGIEVEERKIDYQIVVSPKNQ